MCKVLSILAFALFFTSCVQKSSKNETSGATAFNLETAKKSFLEYKNIIDKAKDEKKLKQKLREDIGIKMFDNEELEISEAELWYDGKDIVRIDVRFYSGAPMGTKHWYVKNGIPVGVSVAQFIQKEDDSVGERLMYELVYEENDQKWHLFDDKIVKQKDFYTTESNKEWELLKNLAEKYKPKVKNDKDED